MAKAASSFDPFREYPDLAKYSSGDLDLSLECLSGDTIGPEFVDQVAALIGETDKPPAGSAAKLAEEAKSFITVRSGDTLLGFCAFHTGAEEVPVLLVDWICVSADIRRKGLGTHLMTILEKTAMATKLPAVKTALPYEWPSSHPSLEFLWKQDWAKDPVQPASKAIQSISKYLDEDAKAKMKEVAEQKRLTESTKASKGTGKAGFAPTSMGHQGMTSATSQ